MPENMAPDLQIPDALEGIRYLCGRPGPFRTVRDLGLVSPGCPVGSGACQGCSSVWLPAARPAGTTNGFQDRRWSRPAVAAARLVGTPEWLAKQDHPANIPRLGCPGRKPPSAGRDQYALKLESLIPALQPDYEPSICEWRHRLGDAPGLTGDTLGRARGLWPGALGGTRTPNLLTRRMCHA